MKDSIKIYTIDFITTPKTTSVMKRVLKGRLKYFQAESGGGAWAGQKLVDLIQINFVTPIVQPWVSVGEASENRATEEITKDCRAFVFC